MPLPLLQDEFEPHDMLLLMRQSIEVEVSDLNRRGYADYLFNAADGHSIQLERKQNGELLPSLNSVEEQLKRQYGTADECGLIVEGFIAPSPKGCYVLKPSLDGKMYFVQRELHTNYSMYVDWLYQLDKCGITCYSTPHIVGTATLLVALYKNSQKEEHTTLRRYIKGKVQLNVENRHIKTLMGIEGASLGERRATDLIDAFGTAWGVLSQSESMLQIVDGVGPGIARKLLWAIGKVGDD